MLASAERPTMSTIGSSPTDERWEVRLIDGTRWDDFAELVERNGGVLGGCWCKGHHATAEGISHHQVPGIDKRATKEELVRSGRAHAALVYDTHGVGQGWAKYGRHEELPLLAQNRLAYEKEPGTLPDWRIPCLSTDTRHRRVGIARVGLAGALALIAADGGGVVESTPEIVGGRVALGRFLFHQASVELFEEHGFARIRRLGTWAWLVRRTVAAAPQE
ncbi:hypothetical protein GCM10009592_20620 [Brachybacterium rhamnosum]